MTAILEVRDLRLALPSNGTMLPVLRGVSFDIAEGEAVALVGESGSGKSMTARSLVRLLPRGALVSGNIRLHGESVLTMDKHRLRSYRARAVAMIFQDPRAHINPVRTVGDFLTEQLRVVRRVSHKDAYVQAVHLLEEVQVPNPPQRLHQYPHELSGGMLQRVMIAGALASQCQLLLADEPTTALDVTIQAEIMAILQQLRRDHQMSLMMITHDLELAAATCDRTLVMYAGVIVESASSASLQDRPGHPYTRALLASRPSLSHRPLRLPTIPGHPLSAAEAPRGCAFSTRCPLVSDICRDKAPPLRQLGSTTVACHHAEHLLAAAELGSGGLL